MSASTMKAKGEKTLAKLEKAVGKRAKPASEIAAKAGVSTPYAQAKLKTLGTVEAVKSGRHIHYRLKAQTANAGAVQA